LPDLPDGGPRYEKPVRGAGAAAFEQGVNAYEHHRYQEAKEAFQQVVAQHPDSVLVEPARAFLAELLLADQRTQRGFAEAIAAYFAILRDFPSSPNQARNRWRLGDLYTAMELYAEAQGMYERALADSPTGQDEERALLGLAVNFLKWEKWQEAERYFQLLRTRASDQAVLRLATIGMADTFYAQQRLNEAQSLYDASYRRWPDFVKQHPEVLLKYAEATMALGQDPLARRLYNILYNLYPQAAEAPIALVQIGDSYRRGGLPEKAGLFYAEAVVHHPKTLGETVARMRLAELGVEKVSAGRGRRLRMEVENLFREGPTPSTDLMVEQGVFQSTAEAHADWALGSEALFHLGERFELQRNWLQAVRTYRQLRGREGQILGDSWPGAAGRRLSAILEPRLNRALEEQDGLAVITLFHLPGGKAEDVFADDHLLFRVAAVHRKIGFTEEAVRLQQALLKRRLILPLKEEALMELGQCYMDQEDYVAAKQVFERYRIQHPLGRWKAEALRFLALAYRAQRDHLGAVRASRRWLENIPAPAHPLRPGMLLLLAEELAESGDTEEAFQVYQEAGRTGALTQPAALIRYADLLAREKRYDEAVTQYRLALRASPEATQEEWARFQMARIRRAQNHQADARSQLQELAEMSQDDLVDRLTRSMQAALPEKGGL
jgi:TolA-binding protein